MVRLEPLVNNGSSNKKVIHIDKRGDLGNYDNFYPNNVCYTNYRKYIYEDKQKRR